MVDVELCPWCKTTLGPNNTESFCGFCEQAGSDGTVCRNGHRVCGDCRIPRAAHIIERICLLSSASDPAELCIRLLRHPALRPMGEGHHLILAPVLLAAIRNAGQLELNPCWLSAAMNRLDDVPTYACSFRGQCGALLGVGAAVSVLANDIAGMPSDRARILALRASAEALFALAETNVGICCTLSVFIGLQSAVRFLSDQFAIVLPLQPITCEFADDPTCQGTTCPFHPHFERMG